MAKTILKYVICAFVLSVAFLGADEARRYAIPGAVDLEPQSHDIIPIPESSSESQSDPQAALDSELSPLVAQIRRADSIFYQGLVQWSKDGDEASKYLKQACELKHPGACLYLANYYEQKDQRENAKSFREQSKITSKEALAYYTQGYQDSIEACKAGAEEWCSIQAVALIDGRGVEKDITRGLEFLDIMCERDMVSACAILGAYHYYGANVPKDLNKAQSYNLKALKLDTQNCSERKLYSCVVSAEIYQQGLSVAQDLTKAKEFYRQACSLGNKFACDYVLKLK